MSQRSTPQLDELLKKNAPAGLTPQEKAKMRVQLASFVEKHPVQAARFSWTQRFFSLRPILAGLTVVLLFSSVSVASAQTALPGDFLYDFKLFVNEELPSSFMDEEEKKAFALEQLENRLEEAEALKAKGILDEAKELYLQEQIESHLMVVVEEEVDEDLVEQFSTLLDEHEEILSDVRFDSWKGKNKFKDKDKLLPEKDEDKAGTQNSLKDEEEEGNEDENLPALNPDTKPPFEDVLEAHEEEEDQEDQEDHSEDQEDQEDPGETEDELDSDEAEEDVEDLEDEIEDEVEEVTPTSVPDLLPDVDDDLEVDFDWRENIQEFSLL